MHLWFISLEMQRILLVEDSPSDREILKYLLEEQFKKEVVLHEAPSLSKAVEILDKEGIDCVVLDLQLPDSAGKETFQKLYARYSHIPFIVMTNNKDRLLAVEMIQLGAADFVLKNYTDEEDIFRRIVFAIEKHKRSVRVDPTEADSFRRVSSANFRLVQAQEDDASPSTIRNIQVETTAAVADLSRKTFAALQEINISFAKNNMQWSEVAKTVAILDKELLRGHSNRPSMRSQMDLMDHRIQVLEGEVNGLQEDVTETNITAIKENNQTARTKLSMWTKLLIALLTLLGVLATAAATYFAAAANASKKEYESLKDYDALRAASTAAAPKKAPATLDPNPKSSK